MKNEERLAELLPQIMTIEHNWPIQDIIDCLEIVLDADIKVHFHNTKAKEEQQ